MKIITKISVQEKRKDRYNIFLNEKYAFSVDEAVLIKHNLVKGQQLTEEDIEQIQVQEEDQKAYGKAINFLSYRMRSTGEVFTYLKEQEVEEHVIQQILSKLMENGYLDDLAFANAYVRTMMETTDKGPNVLKQELKLKSVSDAKIEEALLNFSEERMIEKVKKLAEKVAKKQRTQSAKMLQLKVEEAIVKKGYPAYLLGEVKEEFEEQGMEEEEEWARLVTQGEKFARKYDKFEGYEKKMKLKQALFRKGFPLHLIDRYLEEE
ncbi:recombination regulator RecX [Mangrovibacillus cuniculi]|uniref:Regulatory protein RecX n=1 Tax=Mangrovibacillus cuniculi TaxID=2593652 RepID=A0A7S8HEI4_9BACI|nr:recombination regulator RecX [Mangrovibacillus cuniculi]QPC45773.1 recombination regulator RecX [Mangrovibacillus cuniculi]